MPQYYNPITREVEELDEEQAVDRELGAPGQGIRRATDYEVERDASEKAYGSTAQQLAGYAEKAIPGARHFGVMTGLTDEKRQRGRAQYLERENPISAGAASAVPDIAIAMLGGAGAQAAARAAQLTSVGGRVLAGTAEAVLGGYMGEAERAFVEDEDFNVGNMLMYGVGGELFGRAVAAGAGAVGRNVLAMAERRALKASARAAAEQTAKDAEKAAAKAAKTFDAELDAAREVARSAPAPDFDIPDAPIQHEWAATTAQQIREELGSAHPATRAADDLAFAKTGQDVYRKAGAVAEALDPEDAIQGNLRAALDADLRREDLWTAKVADARKARDAAAERALRPDAAWAAPDAARDALDGLEALGADTGKLREALKAGDAARSARAAAGVETADRSLRQTIGDDVADAAVGAAMGAVTGSLGLGAVGSAALRAARYTGLLKSLTAGGVAKIRDTAATLVRPARVATKAAGPVGAVLAAEHGPTRRGALTRFQGPYPTPQAAFAARRDELLRAHADPIRFAEGVAKNFGALASTHPTIYPAVAQRVGTMAAYLKEHLPVGIVRTLRHPNGLPPTQEALAQYAAIYEAVTDPASTLDDLAAGTVRPEAIQALRDVHPDLYQSVRYAVIRELATAGPGVPTQTKVRLDLLLELDGAATPAFSSAVAATVKAASEAQAERAGGQVDLAGAQDARGVASLASGPTAIGGGQGVVSR